MNIQDIFAHAMIPLDQHGPRRSAATEPRPRAGIAQEGSPPAAVLGTAEAGILASQRARIYALEQFVEKLYDALPEDPDKAYDLVRAEYLAIHGPR